MKKQHTQPNLLKQAMLKVHNKLAACGIPHAVTFGTLLGLMRSGEPLPGDNDVDFMVLEAPGLRTAMLRFLQQHWDPGQHVSHCEQQFKSPYYMP